MDRPALTIWQPWATLIVTGIKRFEFRGYPAPASVVGKRIVIHSGKRKPDPDEMAAVMLQPHRTCGAAVDFDAADAICTGHLPLAAGLGEATLGRPVLAIEEPALIALAREMGEDPSDMRPDIWAWPMLEPVAWDRPVPARGHQGFWPWAPAPDLFA